MTSRLDSLYSNPKIPRLAFEPLAHIGCTLPTYHRDPMIGWKVGEVDNSIENGSKHVKTMQDDLIFRVLEPAKSQPGTLNR
jgi:hypothetical protein